MTADLRVALLRAYIAALTPRRAPIVPLDAAQRPPLVRLR